MKAMIIGLGSMGRRRARLLKKAEPNVKIVGVDMQQERCVQAKKELGIETCSSIDEACSVENLETAFVSTSPLSHSFIIKDCLEHNLHVFTELNLVDTGYEENIRLAKEKDKILFLSSTFLYRKEIDYIRQSVRNSRCRLSYTYHTGQYLPDWHPWESYKDFFAGDKRTNGCRETMAIEFPWLIDVFGRIKDYHMVRSRDSNLDIDFPDTYQILFEHETGHKGLVQIDVVSRKAVRNLELSGEDLYLTWKGNPDTINKYDIKAKQDTRIQVYENYEHRDGYSNVIIEDAYLREIKNFISVVNGEEKPLYSFEKDAEILHLIDMIEGE